LDQIPFNHYETNIFNNIKEKLYKKKCSIMWGNQREFINGIIRKIKPKKILELGVAFGGSSIIILNAIKD
jgi:predicted O-methyltransferase YrrM